MKKILGAPQSIRDLFTSRKYTIHYFQREYQWYTKQIEELLNDLLEQFYSPSPKLTSGPEYSDMNSLFEKGKQEKSTKLP